MPIDEAQLRIHDGSLFDRLEKQYSGDPYYLDPPSHVFRQLSATRT